MLAWETKAQGGQDEERLASRLGLSTCPLAAAVSLMEVAGTLTRMPSTLASLKPRRRFRAHPADPGNLRLVPSILWPPHGELSLGLADALGTHPAASDLCGLHLSFPWE